MIVPIMIHSKNLIGALYHMSQLLLFDIVIQSYLGGKKCKGTSPMNIENCAFYSFRIHYKNMQTFQLR